MHCVEAIQHSLTATIVATIIFAIELGAISWIRAIYMDTPFLAAACCFF